VIYDRLLELCEDQRIQTDGSGAAIALRAVVELHKPIDNPNFPDSDRWCWQCAEGRGYAKYPCPTIQAIEKELG
jgi:hypothetical protein